MTSPLAVATIQRAPTDLLESVDTVRKSVSASVLNPSTRGALGQFMTPSPIASLMASMFTIEPRHVRLLDAGAGVGSLTAAFSARMCGSGARATEAITATAFEVDSALLPFLRETLDGCRGLCSSAGIDFRGEVRGEDFIAGAVAQLAGDLFASRAKAGYNAAILNPPYRKIRTDSRERELLASVGIETSNMYSAFVALAIRLLEPDGEVVAITPRSFCNGPYFKPFRTMLLDEMAINRIHVFESRDRAFSDDEVLQENVIVHTVKRRAQSPRVTISTSNRLTDQPRLATVSFAEVVDPGDPNRFIHLRANDADRNTAKRVSLMKSSLRDLGISVSTGRVVDFRAKAFLRKQPEAGGRTVPLIYPCHFGDDGFVAWPNDSTKKANAILDSAESQTLLVPEGTYVLVRRFSSKEERRRIVATVYDPSRVCAPRVGFENHVNYFHTAGAGLDRRLALGLAVFLNSTLIDDYFRQFNGHTQVNATDLRSLPYPDPSGLRELAACFDEGAPTQSQIDAALEDVLSRTGREGLG